MGGLILFLFALVEGTATAAVFLYPLHKGYVISVAKNSVLITENGFKLNLNTDAIRTPGPWKRGQYVSFVRKDVDLPQHVEAGEIVW